MRKKSRGKETGVDNGLIGYYNQMLNRLKKETVITLNEGVNYETLEKRIQL